jgi:hypothetical protein
MKIPGSLRCALWLFLFIAATGLAPSQEFLKPPTPRPPRGEADLRYWLENMVWHHGFSVEEITAATGMDPAAIAQAKALLNITAETRPKRPVDPPLLVLPYPGGRHPRLGFFDGAVDPQRETKLSIFPPWQDGGYAVLDVPEAIWSNLGLTYLAHTHIPTIWTNRGITLPAQEWERRADGSLTSHRKLPNGIEFSVLALPHRDRVELRMSLQNGTPELLTGLKVQMCVMLGRARGFEAQIKENKVLAPPFAAARSADGNRWIITGWQPVQRVWENPPCPCIHSDPQFPDCPPGESREVHGWVSFYQGGDIQAELKRLGEVWKPLSHTTITGRITNDKGQPVAARLYIEGAAGFHFAESAEPGGEAIRYDKKNWVNPRAIERHTSLSAHAFRASLPPGDYKLTVERGLESVPLVRNITVGSEPLKVALPLGRWVNMAAEGWYSGDTHVHRPLAELPTAMLAEDLNVAFPFTYWVTHAFTPPGTGDRTLTADAAAPARLIVVDDTHVIWPRNTEWEIFTVRGKQHTLGALFALNHRTPFAAGIPPLAPVIEQARREGALFDMDKHDWPFALVLPPLLGPSLFELANNHMWRTEFGFTKWNGPAPGWAFPDGRERREGTEKEWIGFTHRVYWALLNCGLRIQPTAGTASGVHPVPLGFGRVYVHLPDGFSYDAWIKGLAAGRSFVTTGPMIESSITENEVQARIFSRRPATLEIIVNGRIVHSQFLPEGRLKSPASTAFIRSPLAEKGTRWVALRVWEMEGDRPRFAHTAPVWFEVPGQPLSARREEAEWLASRVREEITRSRDLLPAAALAEYEQALQFYETAAKNAAPQSR